MAPIGLSWVLPRADDARQTQLDNHSSGTAREGAPTVDGVRAPPGITLIAQHMRAWEGKRPRWPGAVAPSVLARVIVGYAPKRGAACTLRTARF